MGRKTKVSVSDGDLIGPKEAWEKYTMKNRSAGVAAVRRQECDDEGLPVNASPEADAPEHADIDFSMVPKKEIETKSKLLHLAALQHGWQFGPIGVG